MRANPRESPTTGTGMTDEEIVARVRAGEGQLFELIMRRHNRRLYRAARGIVGEDEADDVVQAAYLDAYAHLDQFAGRARFATWLTRIAVHEALGRARRSGRFPLTEDPLDTDMVVAPSASPERTSLDRELGRALEAAVDALPDVYRPVFMLRDIEELSTAETAECLGIPAETVKTRLHRARTFLRNHLQARAWQALPGTFDFGAARCDALVAAVMGSIAPS
jgi:RNA polymerase sigma-70 factor, ECF subfamily